MSEAIVVLKKGEGRTIKAGGAWIYDNEIDRIEGDFTPGDIVAGQIAGVMGQALKILNLVFTTHIPAYVVGLSYHYLGDGCGPRASTNNCYLTAVVHIFWV